MTSFQLHLQAVDDLLRSRAGVLLSRAAEFRCHILIMLVLGMAYGAVMGSFGGFTGDRPLQILFSAVKVPLLLSATFLLSLPSFLVINTILGLREHFPHVLRALIATQAAHTVILASFAPFTALFYASSDHYEAAVLFNTLMFGLAGLAAQLLLLRLYRPLIARHSRHRIMVRLWLVNYAFIGIQMGWLLRPFVGSPTEPATFFRQEAWGNAYMAIINLITRLIAA